MATQAKTTSLGETVESSPGSPTQRELRRALAARSCVFPATDKETKTMPTMRDYFEDTYQFEGKATVVEVMGPHEHGNAKMLECTCVVLDRTIFHPQGGGQPSDVGTMTSDTDRFEVVFVTAVDDVIYHYGHVKGSLSAGDLVSTSVDPEKRMLYARFHSAGHLVETAVTDLGFDMKSNKWFCFPSGPYGEYQGSIPPAERANAVAMIQARVDEMVKADVPITQYTKDGVRLVQVGDSAPGRCGGTHVKTAAEVGAVHVVKWKKKGKNSRLSYKLVE